MDAHAGSLSALLELSRRDEQERGLGDAPWPPHFAKQRGEPKRVQPSRARPEG
jgi:bifunctional non-homologous end joining protein LigD